MTYAIRTYDIDVGDYTIERSGMTMPQLKREVDRLNRSGYAIDLDAELGDAREGLNDPSVIIEEETPLFVSNKDGTRGMMPH